MRGIGSLGRAAVVLGGAGLAASTLAAMAAIAPAVLVGPLPEPELIRSRRVARDKWNWKPTKAPPFRPVGNKRSRRRRQ